MPSMSLDMHRLTLPVFVRGFGVLKTLLDRAEAYADENGLSHDEIINARLAPDMLPLAGQIQRASDTSKGAIVRLTGVEAPKFPDTETSFAALHARIDATLAFFSSLDPNVLGGAENTTVTLNFTAVKPTLSGVDYVLQFVLPNFFFHITTAHDILRHKGLTIGKVDYLGPWAA
jgi:uncharacterized protein